MTGQPRELLQLFFTLAQGFLRFGELLFEITQVASGPGRRGVFLGLRHFDSVLPSIT